MKYIDSTKKKINFFQKKLDILKNFTYICIVLLIEEYKENIDKWCLTFLENYL